MLLKRLSLLILSFILVVVVTCFPCFHILKLHLTDIAPVPTIVPTPTPVPEVTLGLVGDLGLGRFITYTARLKNDFNYSLAKVSPWLQSNDFNLANLESPIIENCPTVAHNTFKFCGDPGFLPYLYDNKFVFNLANNHINNYGQDGFIQTQSFLHSNLISYFNSHYQPSKFLQMNISGITFGFIGFDFISNPNMDKKIVVDMVKLYDPQVDWLVVSLHWGNEYVQSPERWRVDLAHQLIDSGADIIHGHHPHVWQDYEIYQDRPIFYSLGNFVFDQNWSTPTSQSNIARLTLTKDTIKNLKLFPIEIKENCQPVITN